MVYKVSTKFLIALCLLCFLSGCMLVTKAELRQIHCAGWSAIYIDEDDYDRLSSDLARKLLRHNRFGEKSCNWGQ